MVKRKRRNFTPEFKTEVVLEAIRGESSQAELCRRHNISENQFLKSGSISFKGFLHLNTQASQH